MVAMLASVYVVMGMLISAVRVLVRMMMVVGVAMLVRVLMGMCYTIIVRVLMGMSMAVDVLMGMIVFVFAFHVSPFCSALSVLDANSGVNGTSQTLHNHFRA